VIEDVLPLIRETKGFMPEDEGAFLHAQALSVLRDGPGLEVGSYCGKSALYLGDAARQTDSVVFALDHHRGSEENQAGWEHHDTEVVDETGRMDTLPFFRRAIAAADLEEHVVALVGQSTTVARHWRTPLALLFIDGGHGEKPAHDDYQGWVPWVQPNGLLLIHDVFPDPADGGRPPYEIYLRALESGELEEVGIQGSMRALRRTSGVPGALHGV
jgi:predicted O-methyltransferase YrrM